MTNKREKAIFEIAWAFSHPKWRMINRGMWWCVEPDFLIISNEDYREFLSEELRYFTKEEAERKLLFLNSEHVFNSLEKKGLI